MIVLLSPAKTLDFESPSCTDLMDQPQLLEHAKPIVERMKKMSPKQLEKLMSISQQLALLNADRFQQWQPPFTPENAKQAVLAFKGDVYLGLEAETFQQKDFEFAHKHLRILSGLYGLLKPLDLIQPYRLEMGTKVTVKRKKNLYEYWKKTITEELNQALEGKENGLVVNLASKEYFKAVDVKKLKAPVLTIDFKEEDQGKFKVIGFFAKKARGMMGQFIVRNRLTKAEDLKGFNEEGYRFNPELSQENHWVFSRPKP